MYRETTENKEYYCISVIDEQLAILIFYSSLQEQMGIESVPILSGTVIAAIM